MQLNIQPQAISFGSNTALLNGPATYAPQPRIRVRSVQVTNPSLSTPVSFSIFKNGSVVAAGNAPIGSTVIVPIDTILETADALTGSSTSTGSLEVSLSADIDF